MNVKTAPLPRVAPARQPVRKVVRKKNGPLVLERADGQAIVMTLPGGEEILMQFRIRGTRVRVLTWAPDDVAILREEKKLGLPDVLSIDGLGSSTGTPAA